MVQTMHENSMNPRITGKHFPGIPCRRITVKYTSYVFTNTDWLFLKVCSRSQVMILNLYAAGKNAGITPAWLQAMLNEFYINVIPGELTDIQNTAVEDQVLAFYSQQPAFDIGLFIEV
jgi:hypothetical protein